MLMKPFIHLTSFYGFISFIVWLSVSVLTRRINTPADGRPTLKAGKLYSHKNPLDGGPIGSWSAELS